MTGEDVRRNSVVFALLATIAALTLAACGGSKNSSATPTSSTISAKAPNPNAPELSPAGDIPDNQAYVPFTSSAGFTLKYPEGWPRSVTASGVTMSATLNSIHVEVTPMASAPTLASARSNEVPKIASASGYQAGSITTVTRKGGTAVLITYRASSAPDPVTGKTVALAVERYEFWKAGKEAIVTLSSPVGADNVDPWKIVTDSFTWR
jgi:ABC-type Fe3+-hydroxamate transport system substrate-binding protein